MRKTFVGPKLRELRRERNQTQAEMAKALGVSAAYVNLLENNQRSLSVQVLMSLSDAYAVDWRDLIKDEASNTLADLRNILKDPAFDDNRPDLQELRAAIDHAPKLVDNFLRLYQSNRAAHENLMRLGETGEIAPQIDRASPETVIHDFFRNHSNYFDALEKAAEKFRAKVPFEPDDVYATLKNHLKTAHGIEVSTRPTDEMGQGLRDFDSGTFNVYLSEALDHQNRVFQLAHVLCFVEFSDVITGLTKHSGTTSESGLARCQVELANYFAAALLMPYEAFLNAATTTAHDIDRISAMFGVSFEQVCHRLTTLQRPGARGIPFFFLRVDKAGNVTKRFNSTSFNLAEYGGACPVWNIHTSFRTPDVVVPQFVELPEGDRFFTISRTSDRPVFNRTTQDRRLALALGCELQYASEIGYAAPFKQSEEDLFAQIGINCHLCVRQACSQRAHQPLLIDLPIDPRRRGNTRYES